MRLSEGRHIALVVGTRPNFMKAMPVLDALGGHAAVRLIHTGQHYSPRMSDSFFADLRMQSPDVHLGVGSGSHAEQTGRALIAIEHDLAETRPDLVVVVGDVNSTLAAALAAAKLGIPVAHIEAGLRSGDSSMPEEINRLLTDHLSRWLFTHSAQADANLAREGIAPDRVHRVGNVMIDSLLGILAPARKRDKAKELGIEAPYGVATLHRPSNVDTRDNLVRTIEALRRVADLIPLVLPVHPRLHEGLNTFRLTLPPTVRRVQPMGYVDFISLVDRASLVLTDSGGVQEETSVLGIPCLTMRTTTERPITVTAGTNRVVGVDPTTIEGAAREALQESRRPADIPMWDGKAAIRIRDVLLQGPT